MLLAAFLLGMLLSVNAVPLGPAAGAIAKKVATAVITGVSFASLDAGLNSLASKPNPAPTTPAPKPASNSNPDYMIVIVCTTGASVFLVFLILLTISLVKVLSGKLKVNNSE